MGASNLNAFAGVNGPASEAGALGLSLSGVDFALALAKAKAPALPTVPTDLRSFTALKATVASASFIGVEGLTVEVTTLAVAINQGGGTDGGVAHDLVIDFNAGGTAGAQLGAPLTVNTGGGNSIDLDFEGDDGTLLKAEGTVDIGVFGFFFVSGNFAFEKKSATVDLSGGASPELDVAVDLLTVGASNVNAFAGIGGPATNDGAIGLSLGDVNFALALVSLKQDPGATGPVDARKWTALKADVGSAGFIGVDGITLEATNLLVAINQGSGMDAAGAVNATVLDFSTPLTVNTGGGNSIDLDFDGADGTLLKAEGTVAIDIFGFFSVSGNFAFENPRDLREKFCIGMRCRNF